MKRYIIFFGFLLVQLALYSILLFADGMNKTRVTKSASTQKIKGIIFVSIPGDSFTMGDEKGDLNPDCRPVHTVTVSSFQMSDAEITNAQYCEYLNMALARNDITATNSTVMGITGPFGGQEYIELSGNYNADNQCCITYSNNKFSVLPGRENWPVVYVTWYGAKAFAEYYGWDLPLEAEWEYACRGGKKYLYGTDDGTISSAKANYDAAVGHPVPVKSYPQNPYGLYDMSGNVCEWCGDWFESYSAENVKSVPGARLGSFRVLRGGGWSGVDSVCRSDHRSYSVPGGRNYAVGFRVVRR